MLRLALPASGRLLRRLLALTVLLGAALSPAAAAASGPETDAVESDLLSRVNAARPGLPPLAAHPQLAATAHAQASWLAQMSAGQQSALSADTAHCGGAGCPAVRATAAGWPDARTIMGEVIAFGGRAGGPAAANASTIVLWQRSPMHRAQLRGAAWRSAGAAIVGEVAVVVFAERCTSASCVSGSVPRRLPGPTTAAGGTGASPAGGTGPGAARTEGSGAPAGAVRQPAGCTTLGRIRVLRRRAARRRTVEVRLSCRRPGRRYTARLRDGRRARTVALRGGRTLMRVPLRRRNRFVEVSIAAAGTRLGSVRVVVPAA